MGDNKWLRNSFVYVIIMVAVLVLLFAFLNPRNSDQSVTLTKLAQDVKAGDVESIKLQDDSNQVYIKYKAGHTPQAAVTTKEQGVSLTDALTGLGVPQDSVEKVIISVEPASSWG